MKILEKKLEGLKSATKQSADDKKSIVTIIKSLSLEELIIVDPLIKRLLKLDFFIDETPLVEWLGAKFLTDEYAKFIIKNNYKVKGEAAVYWALNKNLYFGNMHALEWIIVYFSSVNAIHLIEWSIKNNLKVGKDPTLKWVTEIGMNKEYFVNYAVINDCKIGNITALEWVIMEKELRYNKIIQICKKKGVKIDNQDPIKWARSKNLI